VGVGVLGMRGVDLVLCVEAKFSSDSGCALGLGWVEWVGRGLLIAV
jgi:hypothetical protein